MRKQTDGSGRPPGRSTPPRGTLFAGGGDITEHHLAKKKGGHAERAHAKEEEKIERKKAKKNKERENSGEEFHQDGKDGDDGEGEGEGSAEAEEEAEAEAGEEEEEEEEEHNEKPILVLSCPGCISDPRAAHPRDAICVALNRNSRP